MSLQIYQQPGYGLVFRAKNNTDQLPIPTTNNKEMPKTRPYILSETIHNPPTYTDEAIMELWRLSLWLRYKVS